MTPPDVVHHEDLDGHALVGVPVASCRNCGEPLTGDYCARCGQRVLPPDPSLRELVAEAWNEVVAVDGKVLGSVRLLMLRPGVLTTEYLDGRRARYLPPVRLYLVCSVLYFLVSASLTERPDVKQGQTSLSHQQANGRIVPAREDGAAPIKIRPSTRPKNAGELRDSIQGAATLDSSRRAVLGVIGRPVMGPIDSTSAALADSIRLEQKIARDLGPNPGWFKRRMLPRLVRNGARVGHEQRSFQRQMREQMPRMMFVLMPAFALLLAVGYRSRRRRLPTHLIMSLHLHAFGFVAITFGAILSALTFVPIRRAGMTVVALGMAAYLPLAFQRVYGGRLRYATLRAVTLVSIYFVMGIMLVSLLAIALVMVY